MNVKGSVTNRTPQEAGLHTPGKPRPTNATVEGLRTQRVEQLPRVSRPISQQLVTFPGAPELTHSPRARLYHTIATLLLKVWSPDRWESAKCLLLVFGKVSAEIDNKYFRNRSKDNFRPAAPTDKN